MEASTNKAFSMPASEFATLIESEDIVISTAEEFYSLKLAGDHAYLVRDYSKAVELYEKYLRNVFSKHLYLCINAQ